jgi:hypothetical protein
LEEPCKAIGIALIIRPIKACNPFVVPDTWASIMGRRLGDFLKVEPHLTLAKMRARAMFIDESVWNKVADGLRLAGLPD